MIEEERVQPTPPPPGRLNRIVAKSDANPDRQIRVTRAGQAGVFLHYSRPRERFESPAIGTVGGDMHLQAKSVRKFAELLLEMVDGQ